MVCLPLRSPIPLFQRGHRGTKSLPMNTTKSAIKDYLERLSKCLQSFQKTKTELDQAVMTKGKLEEQIEKLEKKSYEDESAIQHLSTARVRLDMCEKTIARLEEKTAIDQESPADWLVIIQEGQSLVSAVLQNSLEQRLKGIAATLLPFSEHERAAENVASKTDAYQYGRHEITRYSLLASSIRIAEDPAAQLIKARTIIENVLTEAAKDSPDMNQFLPSPEFMADGSKASA